MQLSNPIDLLEKSYASLKTMIENTYHLHIPKTSLDDILIQVQSRSSETNPTFIEPPTSQAQKKETTLSTRSITKYFNNEHLLDLMAADPRGADAQKMRSASTTEQEKFITDVITKYLKGGHETTLLLKTDDPNSKVDEMVNKLQKIFKSNNETKTKAWSNRINKIFQDTKKAIENERNAAINARRATVESPTGEEMLPIQLAQGSPTDQH